MSLASNGRPSETISAPRHRLCRTAISVIICRFQNGRRCGRVGAPAWLLGLLRETLSPRLWIRSMRFAEQVEEQECGEW